MYNGHIIKRLEPGNLFEVVNFVATTRRWYRQGETREMQEDATPAKYFVWFSDITETYPCRYDTGSFLCPFLERIKEMIAPTQKIIESIKLTGEQLIEDAELIAGDFYAHQSLNISIDIDL